MVNYPFASSTFTIKRQGQVVQQGYNHVVTGPSTVATGVSIAIRDVNAVLVSEQSGINQQGTYRGSCRATTDIQATDLLIDEVNTESNGAAVTYEVLQVTRYPWFKKLHLHRTVVGS